MSPSSNTKITILITLYRPFSHSRLTRNCHSRYHQAQEKVIEENLAYCVSSFPLPLSLPCPLARWTKARIRHTWIVYGRKPPATFRFLDLQVTIDLEMPRDEGLPRTVFLAGNVWRTRRLPTFSGEQGWSSIEADLGIRCSCLSRLLSCVFVVEIVPRSSTGEEGW